MSNNNPLESIRPITSYQSWSNTQLFETDPNSPSHMHETCMQQFSRAETTHDGKTLITYSEDAALGILLSREAGKWFGILAPGYEQVETMAAALFPQADLDTITNISSLMLILFFIDDAIGNDSLKNTDEGLRIETVVNLQNILAAGLHTDMTTALKQLISRRGVNITSLELALIANWWDLCISAKDSRLQFAQRFMSVAYPYIYANIIPVADNNFDDIFAYITHRVHNSGMLTTIYLLELTMQDLLKDEEFYDSNLVQARWLVGILGALSNDMYSHYKECVVEGSEYNLIAQIQRMADVDVNTAFAMSLAYIDNIAKQYIELRESLLAQYADNALALQYISGLDAIVTASRDWQEYGTKRYASADGTHVMSEMRLNSQENEARVGSHNLLVMYAQMMGVSVEGIDPELVQYLLGEGVETSTDIIPAGENARAFNDLINERIGTGAPMTRSSGRVSSAEVRKLLDTEGSSSAVSSRFHLEPGDSALPDIQPESNEFGVEPNADTEV